MFPPIVPASLAVVSFLKIHASFFCDFILKFIKSSFAFTIRHNYYLLNPYFTRNNKEYGPS